jgi:mannose-6-phosphate isomerase-like protein (cupin superfamily)
VGAVVHGPGEGEVLPVGPGQVVIKAGGEETLGTFFLSESTLAPGMPGPPLHTHEHVVDMFYVLEGTLTFHLGDDQRRLGPGSFACVPPGVAHTFLNPGDAPVRFLNFNTPSGWEDYMRELSAAAADGPPSTETIGRIASSYDIKPV